MTLSHCLGSLDQIKRRLGAEQYPSPPPAPDCGCRMMAAMPAIMDQLLTRTSTLPSFLMSGIATAMERVTHAPVQPQEGSASSSSIEEIYIIFALNSDYREGQVYLTPRRRGWCNTIPRQRFPWGAIQTLASSVH